MQIIKLELRNFQGVKYLKLDFEGESADIFGKNASGKTTIKNAHCWLLVGRAGDGIKNYTPKTNDESGGYQHNLEHSAEETLRRDDGSIVTYKKVYHEVYKKKRGTAQAAPDGNTVDYYINGVPTPEKDYLLSISTLGDPEQLKILTLPEYFSSELPWERRRAVLLTLCGNASDDEVIASTDELKGLKSFLLIPGTTDQYYTTEDYKKIAAAKKAKITEQKKSIPARINEAERAIPANAVNYDKTAVQSEIDAYRAEKENLDRERAESKTSGAAIQAARTARQNAEAKLNDEKSAYIQNINKQNEAAVNKVNELVEEASALARSITANSAKVTDAQAKEKLLTAKRNELIGKYTKRAADVWDPASESCPTCNRALPAEDVERLKSDFNKAKSTDLLKISAEGKAEASADMITEQQNIAHNAQAIVDSLTAKHKALCALIDEERAKVVKTAFEETTAYKILSDEVESCKARELEAKTETGDNDAKYASQLNEITGKISACEVKLEQIKTRTAQLARMAELADEEKQLAKELEEIESGLFLCDSFIRQKVKLLTDSINGRFENVRFRLFVDQVNGGLREDCEVMIPSPEGNLVPYSTANGGAKIIAGIEIIKVLSEHWNMNVPLFVDNAESITSDYGIDGQMIRLTANKADEVLRVEYYSDKEKETA